MFSPYHWLPRVTTLSVELFASTPVTTDENDENYKNDTNYDENDGDDIDGAGNTAREREFHNIINL